MSIALRADFEEVRRVAFGDIGALFTGIGSKLAHPARMVVINNLTDATLNISTNGVVDHLDIPASASIVFDLTANKTEVENFAFAKEMRFYVKHLGVAPTLGSLSLSVIYGDL